jgi:hypothetical protein
MYSDPDVPSLASALAPSLASALAPSLASALAPSLRGRGTYPHTRS